MRKFLFLIILVAAFSWAQSTFFLGAENQHRVYIGYEHKQFIGLFVKNTLFKQDLNLQQIEFNPYINLGYSPSLSFKVNPYFGMRYDSDFYYLGAHLSMDWSNYQYFQLKTEISPYFHKRTKYATIYTSQIQSFILPSIGLVLGAKNNPEYNLIEERMFGGLIIRDTQSLIEATISTPYKLEETHLTRFNISFHHAINL